MFKSDTLIITGAGASCEFGLPLGGDLNLIVAGKAREETLGDHTSWADRSYYESLLHSRHFSGQAHLLNAALRKLHNGAMYAPSIDAFLEIHAQDIDIQFCAKTAIHAAILHAEASSSLRLEGPKTRQYINLQKLKHTWLLELSYLLFINSKAHALKEAFDRIKIVSFNYDRTVEWFLFNALTHLYFLDPTTASQVMSSFDVMHPYGRTGDLNWLSPDQGIAFGSMPALDPHIAAANIRTYSEDFGDMAKIENIKLATSTARTIIFLGLSYHPQNLEIIRPTSPSSVRQIFGTTKGLSEQATAAIERKLKKMFSHSGKNSPIITLRPLACAEFLQQYRGALIDQT